MSRRYTPDEKSAILAQLDLNRGDILLTSHQTGIPTRTLYTWRHEVAFQRRRQRHTTPNLPLNSPSDESSVAANIPSPTIPTFENDLDTMRFMRSRIMQELLNLTVSLNDNFDGTTPYHRVLILSRLLERLMKLDDHLKPYIPAEQVIRIVREQKPYVNPDFYKYRNLQPDALPNPSAEYSQDVEES